MAKFPADPKKDKVIRALARLGFRIVREREHISLERENPDGTKTPMTIPNHANIRTRTLERAFRQSRVDKKDFIKAFES